MSSTLRDLQEDREFPVTVQTLPRMLLQFRDRAPFIAELDGDGPNKLTVGIGPTYGFVQHGLANGEPPYRVARGTTEDGIKTYLITATPTEIEGKYTLPMADLIAILTHFLETNERSPAYEWEVI